MQLGVPAARRRRTARRCAATARPDRRPRRTAAGPRPAPAPGRARPAPRRPRPRSRRQAGRGWTGPSGTPGGPGRSRPVRRAARFSQSHTSSPPRCRAMFHGTQSPCQSPNSSVSAVRVQRVDERRGCGGRAPSARSRHAARKAGHRRPGRGRRRRAGRPPASPSSRGRSGRRMRRTSRGIGSMTAISRPCHRVCSMQPRAGREVTAAGGQVGQGGGLGADHRPGAVVPADLRVPAGAARGRRRAAGSACGAGRAGGCRSRRAARSSPSSAGQVAGEQHRSGYGPRAPTAPAPWSGRARPAGPAAPIAARPGAHLRRAQGVVRQQRRGSHPAGRQGQQELGVVEGRDHRVPRRLCAPGRHRR